MNEIASVPIMHRISRFRFLLLSLMMIIYYSFVTLTSVGYGDIVAITKSARGLSIIEAIMGQLYLAIMVSWLVGQNASQSGIGKGK
jgi:cellulose synthase/poly-beta-1,6-N-acetylglucosamine synthase-like glycosyltransferase